MFVSRPRPHTLAALVRSSQAFTTSSSSRSASPASKPAEDSIFSAAESPWDHVFSDIPDVNSPSPLLPASQRSHSRITALDRLSNSKSSSRSHSDRQERGLLQRSSHIRKQRAAITAREMNVFDEMFDLIFNAVNAQDGKSKVYSSSSQPTPGTLSSSTTSFTGQAPSIGRASAHSPLNDLFRTLRRHTSRVRWTTEIDEELDRKKETMELFNTDQELLQWAMKELFGESQQWDEEAKKAIAIAAAKSGAKDARKAASTATSSSAAPSSSSATPVEPTLNPSIYPHLIAHVMRIFRTTYSNPSLSLAIFNHAARVSIPSYVFGCTAPAYNELMEGKWEGWGDLEGVCNALEEMRANGVVSDGRTRIVVEKVRREVGAARPAELGGKLFWRDDDARGSTVGLGSHNESKWKPELNPLARRVWTELGEAEVMRLLHRIEQLALRDRSRKASPYEELWKNAALKPEEDDGWSFDNWDEDEDKEVRNQRQKHKPRQKRQSSSLRWPEQKKSALPPRDWSSAREDEMAFH